MSAARHLTQSFEDSQDNSRPTVSLKFNRIITCEAARACELVETGSEMKKVQEREKREREWRDLLGNHRTRAWSIASPVWGSRILLKIACLGLGRVFHFVNCNSA